MPLHRRQTLQTHKRDNILSISSATSHNAKFTAYIRAHRTSAWSQHAIHPPLLCHDCGIRMRAHLNLVFLGLCAKRKRTQYTHRPPSLSLTISPSLSLFPYLDLDLARSFTLSHSVVHVSNSLLYSYGSCREWCCIIRTMHRCIIASHAHTMNGIRCIRYGASSFEQMNTQCSQWARTHSNNNNNRILFNY